MVRQFRQSLCWCDSDPHCQVSALQHSGTNLPTKFLQHPAVTDTSQDHKRVGDKDTGPNTGGMGAYSPAPVVTDEVHQRTMERIIWPTVKGMAAEGNTYTGFLYAGLMIDKQGNPKVIEFNCRFGDPETQPIMLRMKSDLVELCLAACEGKLDEKTSEWDERASLGVVMAAGGYPGDYRTGDVIHGLPLEEVADGKVFHAGTKLADDEQVVTSGGRANWSLMHRHLPSVLRR